jgi:two-component system, cell cycle sensor histidine kinase and response regulator CckA
MKDKGKPSHKKNRGSRGVSGAKRPGSRVDARRTGATIGARFQAVFEGSRDAIGVTKAGIHLFVNPAYLELFGFPIGTDLAGKPDLNVIAPESRDQIKAYTLRREQGEAAPSNYVTRGMRTDGSEFDMEVNVSSYQENGEDLILVILRDITERKRAEEEIAERRAMLQQIMDTASVAIGLVDKTGRITHANRRMAEMFGRTLEELVGSEYVDLVHPSERETGRNNMLALLASEIPSADLERLYMRKDGTEFWGHLACRRFYDIHGNELGLLGVIADISKRKQAEEALLYFQMAVGSSTDAIGMATPAGRHYYQNEAYTKLFGLSVSEVDGVSGPPATVYADEKVGRKIFDTIMKGISFVGEVKMLDKDRKERDIYLRAYSIKNKDGYIVGLVGMHTDITERKREEEARRENQARLDLALQSAHMGVWHFEIKDNRRYFDDLTCQLLGIDPATFTGTLEEFLRAVHPEDHEKIKTALARTIEQDDNYEPSYRVIWPDGSVHYIAARGRLVRDDKGQPAKINGILWEITDQRLLEDERLKTEKLESIGTLAGGIAHDFNNLLQGIFGFISMAKLTFDQKDKSLAMLTQAEKALHQSVNLTAQLLTFSKGGTPVKKVFALRPLIENSVAFALSGSRIKHETIIDENLRSVEADEGQIGQVIQNIVLNADQAMPLGGTIRISVRNMPAEAIVPSVNLRGDFVEISIRDQGTGIPAEHLTRIFDPYFTTKVKGSGLGLATSYSIIKNHGGLLRVQSEVHKGTTFFIYLPASSVNVDEPKSQARSAVVRKGRILVMDDDEMIRAVTGELLTELGHIIAFAQTGEAALEIYQAAREAGNPFDVVILDLTIRGGMGGIEALQKLKESDPNVKAIVSSGYSDDVALSNYRGQGFRAFLKKPYNLEELQITLNSLLA